MMMTFQFIWFACCIVVVQIALLHSAVFADDSLEQDAFQRQVLPVLDRYCIECHSHEHAEAKIAFDRFDRQAVAFEDAAVWLKVLDVLEGGNMPPADSLRPTVEEIRKVIDWIENDFLVAQCGKAARSASVVMRRLNRQEYDNTIRDLLGLELHLADDFPQDDIGFGYDNIGSALSVSPSHIEKYLDAAEIALQSAIVLPEVGERSPVELIGLQTYPLPPTKAVEFEHKLGAGHYLADLSLVRVGISESVPPPRLVVSFGKDRRVMEAVRIQDETVVYRFWIKVATGDNQVHVSLAPQEIENANVVNPKVVAANESGDQRYGANRGLHVDSIVVRGSIRQSDDSLPESHRNILFCSPEFGDASSLQCARQIVTRFITRAFRQPANSEEVDQVLTVFQLAYDRGESFERAIQVALTSVLISPKFLFLVEPEEASFDRPLTEFELASRLSYFLWSSMPDERLIGEAHQGTLRTNLRSEVIRMLNDPKSKALFENFTGQWLQLRKLDGATPDPNIFPDFDDQLRRAMRMETEKFIAHILKENRSVLELIDSDYTFVNDKLAKYYGIDEVSSSEFRQVELVDRLRGGVLTQASILTLTSNPNRTSPVKRGQWILQQILGTPPPPPPPNIEPLDESHQAAESASLRDRMELHRSNPQCASCHNQMDPIGFALENYNAVGQWRTTDGDFLINPSGVLPGGQMFENIIELKKVLKSTGSKKFTRCLIENMLTYALGRGLETSDFCTVEAIRGKLSTDDYRIHGILFGIVESNAFQFRGSIK